MKKEYLTPESGTEMTVPGGIVCQSGTESLTGAVTEMTENDYSGYID